MAEAGKYGIVYVEGILTYRPFSPEQIRKPSILKQSPIVTLAKARRFPIGAIGQSAPAKNEQAR